MLSKNINNEKNLQKIPEELSESSHGASQKREASKDNKEVQIEDYIKRESKSL